LKILSPDSLLLQDLPANLKASFSTVQVSELRDYKAEMGRTLIVADNLAGAELVNHVLSQDLRFLLQKNPKFFVEDLETAARLLESPQSYFAKAEEVLLPSLEKKMSAEFCSPNDKAALKTNCHDFISDLNSQNVAESLEAILEELYMNAILDAPVEAKKRGWKHDLYDQGQKARMTIVRNATRLFITCEDPFGALEPKKFLGRLHQVLEQGAGEVMNFKKEGGAGIGCSLIFEHCSSLFLGVLPQKKTVVSCAIPLGLSYRQRAKMQKSLHLIEI